MITSKNINEVRKEILNLKKEKKKVIIEAGDDEFNRKIFENKDVDMVVDLEYQNFDYMKQRNSGLNEILCKLIKKNNITIGIDVQKIKKENSIEKGKIIARIGQNIRLCKRIGCSIVMLNTNIHDAHSLIAVLG